MSERFYLPERLDRPELTLSGPEAHHLSHVLRLGPGASVVLFDGEGSEAVAEVVAVAKRDVTLRPRTVVAVADPTPVPVSLAVAPPKGDRFRWLVEKATELGVARFVPLLTRRTVVDPRESKLDKLRQTVVAACKQSGRSRLMGVTEPVKFETFLATNPQSERLLTLHPCGKPLGPATFGDSLSGVTLLIGPEGGFTDEEVERATAAGAGTAALGRTILRTETAAIAAAAVTVQALVAK